LAVVGGNVSGSQAVDLLRLHNVSDASVCDLFAAALNLIEDQALAGPDQR